MWVTLLSTLLPAKLRDFCFRCGCCCKRGNIVITRQEHELIEKGTGQTVRVEPNGERLLMAKNQQCQFYINGLCSIRDVRPSQCRMYHCGKTSPDAPHIEWVSEIQKIMAENAEYASYRTRMEDEAAAWGNAHGWKWRRP